MSTEILVEVIRILPALLWFALATALIALSYRRIRDELLPRIGGLEAFGVVVTFAQRELDAAIAQRGQRPAPEAASRVMRRAQAVQGALRGARLLWADDEPDNNRIERQMLSTLGVQVDLARSTGEALEAMGRQPYDLLVSDMARDLPDAGLRLLGALRERGDATPAIFYIGYADPARGVPPHALGITDRPDELLHLVCDALERRRL